MIVNPEILIAEIDECVGPCGRMCLGCPEFPALVDIRDTLADLSRELGELRKTRDQSP